MLYPGNTHLIFTCGGSNTMNDREIGILERNRILLVKNIIPTDDFYTALKTCNVLPDSMIKEVKSEKTRDEKISTLLKLLPLGWTASFRKFRHVLNLTGHSILTDQLYEDDTEVKILNAEETFSKFPSVFNQVSDDTKSRFLRFLETKIREKMVKNEWVNFPLERSGKLDAKKAIFEMEKEFKTNLDSKRKQVESVSTEIAEMKEICRRREVEIEILRREMNEMREKYKESVNIQGKFNTANNSTIIRLQEKYTAFNSKIRTMNLLVQNFMGEQGNKYASDSDMVKVSTLERNIRHLLQVSQSNKEIANNVNMEREAILSLLNKSINKKQPLSEIIQKYLEKEGKKKLALFHEIEKLSESASDRSYGSSKCPREVTDMRVLRNMIATIRVEIEHLKKKVLWKDNQITDLLQENANLRQNVGDSKNLDKSMATTITTLNGSAPSSPDSSFDVKFHISNLEDYLQINHLPELSKNYMTDNFQSDNSVGKLSRESTDTSITEQPKETEENGTSDEKISRFPEDRRSINLTGLPVVNDMDALVTMPKSRTNEQLFYYTNPKSTHSEKNRIQTPLDLLTVVETSEDNVELERVSEIMVEKTKLFKLPSLNGANFVDINSIKPTGQKKFKF